MTPSPVGMRCPECAGGRAALDRDPRSGAREAPYATYVLIALNVIVFVAEIAGGGDAASLDGGGQLVARRRARGARRSPTASGTGSSPAASCTPGPLHLFLNMFVLYILGGILEPAIGAARLLGIYFVSLLAARSAPCC